MILRGYPYYHPRNQICINLGTSSIEKRERHIGHELVYSVRWKHYDKDGKLIAMSPWEDTMRFSIPDQPGTLTRLVDWFCRHLHTEN